MSLLEKSKQLISSVEPDAFMNDKGVMSRASWDRHVNDPAIRWVLEQHWTPAKKLFSADKVESLLSQCRKEARTEAYKEALEVAQKYGIEGINWELRRMAESTMEGEKR